MKAPSLTPEQMKKNDLYNWKHDPITQLVYLGHNWSGNGYWHQFAKVNKPDVVWCEVLTSDLHMLEKTWEPLDLSFAERPVAVTQAAPRREPVKPKPQRESPKEITEEGQRRIQAATERRAKRNAKWANQGNSNE